MLNEGPDKGSLSPKVLLAVLFVAYNLRSLGSWVLLRAGTIDTSYPESIKNLNPMIRSRMTRRLLEVATQTLRRLGVSTAFFALTAVEVRFLTH